MRFAKLYVWVSCSDNRPAVYIIMVVEVCLFLQGANTSLSLYCYLLSGSAGAGLQIPHDRSPSDISWLRQDAAPYIFCLSSPRRNGHAHADAWLPRSKPENAVAKKNRLSWRYNNSRCGDDVCFVFFLCDRSSASDVEAGVVCSCRRFSGEEEGEWSSEDRDRGQGTGSKLREAQIPRFYVR